MDNIRNKMSKGLILMNAIILLQLTFNKFLLPLNLNFVYFVANENLTFCLGINNDSHTCIENNNFVFRGNFQLTGIFDNDFT